MITCFIHFPESELCLSPAKQNVSIPSEALVTFEGKESKAMADQLATISKLRLFNRAGILSEEDMLKVEEAVKIQLGIHLEQASKSPI